MAPEMMKDTRMLIIDYDVCRYHSMDVLVRQFQLDGDNGDEGLKHFLTFNADYEYIANSRNPLEGRIFRMVRDVPIMNVYQLFEDTLGVDTEEDYERKVNETISDPLSEVTLTDVTTRFQAVFDRRGITGCILRYPNEPIVPSYMDKLVLFEDEHILDMRMAASIVISRRINTVMMADATCALKLINILRAHGYTDSITFILGCYGYNYIFDPETHRRVTLMHNELFAAMELEYNYEFGYFDPFSGLSYKRRIMKSQEEKQ